MKRWLIAFVLVWTACTRTDGFSPSLIQGPFCMESSSPLPREVKELLSQPFYYLNKGRQCFVFESKDQKYVLKFFNQKYLQMPWYSFFGEKKEREKRMARRHFYENSYAIAYREMGEEILYLHLGPSEELPQVKVLDKGGGSYTLDLTHLPFVLQKKGAPFYPALEAIYQKEGLLGLYREIDSYIAAVSARISKNIADADHNVEDNWGYVEGHLFHLDPGRLYYEDLTDPALRQREWYRATHSFYKWLNCNYPEAADYFKKKI